MRQSKEYIQAYQKAYRLAHKEELNAKARARRAENRDAYLAYERAYRQANREKLVKLNRKWRAKHHAQYSAYRKSYNEQNKDYRNAMMRYYYANDPEYRKRHRARIRANVAIKKGELTRGPCEVCGVEAEAHHDNYDEPLKVRWFCHTHHIELHYGPVN